MRPFLNKNIIMLEDRTLEERKTGILWFLPLILRKIDFEAVIHPPQYSLAQFYDYKSIYVTDQHERRDALLSEFMENEEIISIPNLFNELNYPYFRLNYKKIFENNITFPSSIIWVITRKTEENAYYSIIGLIKKYLEDIKRLLIITDDKKIKQRNDPLKRFFKDEIDADVYNLDAFISEFNYNRDYKKEPYAIDLIDYFNDWDKIIPTTEIENPIERYRQIVVKILQIKNLSDYKIQMLENRKLKTSSKRRGKLIQKIVRPFIRHEKIVKAFEDHMLTEM